MTTAQATPRTAIDVKCPDCWESVRHEAGKGWLHVRTGDWRCRPICACGNPAKHKTGYHGVVMSGRVGFVTTGHVCDACAPKGMPEYVR
jgi:hypothetical protein